MKKPRGRVRDGTRKPWKADFPCGHLKRRANCDVCVALRKPRSRPADERFFEKIDRRGPGECWTWTGSKDQFGRGYFLYEGKVRRAPRVAWALHHGVPFPDDRDACHTCDNPTCVNPFHIWPGTAHENLQDAGGKGRLVHTLTPEMVREMRTRYAAGERLNAIARTFGVAPGTARGAILRDTWRHVA